MCHGLCLWPVSETRLWWCGAFRNLCFHASMDQTRVMQFSQLDHLRRSGFPVKLKTKVSLHGKGSQTNAILLGRICLRQQGPNVRIRLLMRAVFSLSCHSMQTAT